MSEEFTWRPVQRPTNPPAAPLQKERAEAQSSVKPVTVDTYSRVVARLYRLSTEKRSTDAELQATITDLDVVNDFIESTRDRVEVNTFRLYRAALQWHFEQRLKSSPPERQASIVDAQKVLEQFRFRPAPDLPQRTSAGRRRNVTEEDLGRLLNVLNGGRSTKINWKLRAAHWLLAGLGTGLRPSEWEFAAWIDGTDQLLVQNAKWRGGMPDEARFRVIPVPEDYRIWVSVHMASVRDAMAEGYSFKQAYNHCRAAIRRACEQLWGVNKRFSLYTIRGQFASNAKAILPLGEVSTLMGHKGERTTKRNYGKRRYAHASVAAQVPAPQHAESSSEVVRTGQTESAAPSQPFASLARFAER